MTEQQEKKPHVIPPPSDFETRVEERAQLRAERRVRIQEKQARRKTTKRRPPARALPSVSREQQMAWEGRGERIEAQHPTDGDSLPPHIRRFFRALYLATPRTFVTESIVVINLLIFGVMLVYGVHILTPKASQLVEWGANYGPFTLSGQTWRLLTATFLHAGIFHLLINMWVLWDLREVVERLTGSAGFFLLYFFSGIMGSLASVFWNPATPSVGASGAIFGVFGGLLSFVWVNRESIPREILQSLRSSAIMIFVLNLVISIGASNIDTAGHIGGLLAGLGAGSILSQPVTGQMRKARLLRNLLLLGVASLVIAISWYVLPKDAGALLRFVKSSENTERLVFSRFRAASLAFQNKKIDAKRFASLLAEEILPPWEKMMKESEQISPRYVNFSQEKHLKRVVRSFHYRAESWRSLRQWLMTGEQRFLRASVEQKQLAEAALQDDPRAKHPDLFQPITRPVHPRLSMPSSAPSAPSAPSVSRPTTYTKKPIISNLKPAKQTENSSIPTSRPTSMRRP